MDFSGFKRYGYRVSRLFIGADVVLLLCVCISAGVQASSGGLNAGFVRKSSISATGNQLMISIGRCLGTALHSSTDRILGRRPKN